MGELRQNLERTAEKRREKSDKGAKHEEQKRSYVERELTQKNRVNGLKSFVYIDLFEYPSD